MIPASLTVGGDTRRFKPYPDYTDPCLDWLSNIPVDWKTVRMRFLTAMDPSRAEVRSLAGDARVSFVPMEAIGEWGGLDLRLLASA